MQYWLVTFISFYSFVSCYLRELVSKKNSELTAKLGLIRTKWYESVNPRPGITNSLILTWHGSLEYDIYTEQKLSIVCMNCYIANKNIINVYQSGQ